ncbi:MULTISPECIES: PLP-dependent aminotransferase family protein [Sphingobacterium]|uniref:PLP-dependent aminotransferase family protein n=1 Tax=Sphingobacterium athyrii TaxID=2152717 RepID=A0A363NX59_9SPHI|nr:MULTISPECIES: PLP-dependent aminotransferase family protein [Sphingobacterium]PUV25308.1 PLP-dependent aminotransferase family protein [Sphingobacterium athyrii]QIH34564.1 PLP-dependent aminotransferase family protein [Sphingobacterium sp. DR205]
MPREILYLKIAKILENQILSETLRTGDKLPSLRSLQKIYNVGLNTAQQAYTLLESKSLIISKPKSGYFVSGTSKRKLALPSVSNPIVTATKNETEYLTYKVFDVLRDKSVRQFSLGVPDEKLLPISKLNKGIIKVMRELDGSGTAFEPAQGSLNLRRNIAKWSLAREGELSEDDIITTLGTMNAIYLCLNAVTKPGDTIATESPVYFGILQLAKSMGLNILELPTHPVTGVDLEALKQNINKIDLCCFTCNFNNPLGSLMPDENKKALVELLTHYNVPLVDDDLFGVLHFGETHPTLCKNYDEAGIVMSCGGFSKTLAPGYRIGWIEPGQFKEKILWNKLVQTVAMPSLLQEVIADFMENGRYDHHLRVLRHTLYTNCLKFQQTIEEHFPDNTKISQPQGGFFLWLELDKKIDTRELYDIAIRQKISFAPGSLFTGHNQFNNCMRLNFALKWDEHVYQDLRRLGNMVKRQINL